MAAEDRGPLMHAHVDMMLAFHGAKPTPNSIPRKLSKPIRHRPGRACTGRGGRRRIISRTRADGVIE
jgi:hypothetical protein